jgi:peroxiredoxin
MVKMASKENNLVKGWPVYLIFLILIGAVIWALRNQPSRSEFGVGGERFRPADTHVDDVQLSQITQGEPRRLAEIIDARRTWKPVWTEWYGQTAPALELKDIGGKTHKLSDYRGKNVLLIFWATWCAPCLVEVPHLIELRKRISEDELAMLAISNEDPTTLQRYADVKGLNYTVISDRGPLPAPFGGVQGIPAGFVIDKEGKIKLATEGLVSLMELVQILRAKQ